MPIPSVRTRAYNKLSKLAKLKVDLNEALTIEKKFEVAIHHHNIQLIQYFLQNGLSSDLPFDAPPSDIIPIAPEQLELTEKERRDVALFEKKRYREIIKPKQFPDFFNGASIQNSKRRCANSGEGLIQIHSFFNSTRGFSFVYSGHRQDTFSSHRYYQVGPNNRVTSQISSSEYQAQPILPK